MYTPYTNLLEKTSELCWEQSMSEATPYWLSWDIDEWFDKYCEADDRLNALDLLGCLDAPLPELR